MAIIKTNLPLCKIYIIYINQIMPIPNRKEISVSSPSGPNDSFTAQPKPQVEVRKNGKQKLNTRKHSAPEIKVDSQPMSLKDIMPVPSPKFNVQVATPNLPEKKHLNTKFHQKTISCYKLDSNLQQQDISSLEGKSYNAGLSGDEVKDFQNIIQFSGNKKGLKNGNTQAMKNNSKIQQNLMERVREKQEEIMQQIDNMENYLSLTDKSSRYGNNTQREMKAQFMRMENQKEFLNNDPMSKFKNTHTQTDKDPYVTEDDFRLDSQMSFGRAWKDLERVKSQNDEQAAKVASVNIKKLQSPNQQKSTKKSEVARKEKEHERLEQGNANKGQNNFSQAERTGFHKQQQSSKNSQKKMLIKERDSPEPELIPVEVYNDRVKNNKAKSKNREDERPAFSKYQSKR